MQHAAMCVACDGARTADAGSALVSLVGSVRRTSVEPLTMQLRASLPLGSNGHLIFEHFFSIT